MRQYMEIKGKYSDCIVLFRMGDFYETFFEDAKTVARELEITLTSRGMRNEQKIPLAGVPYHSIDTYLPRLVKKGHRVALVEQLEDPKFAKGVVKRGLVRIVSPGTMTAEGQLTKANNFLAAISFSEKKAGLALIDITTGEFRATEASPDDIRSELEKHSPSEIIVPTSYLDSTFCKSLSRYYLHCIDDFRFYYKNALESLSIKISFEEKELAVSSAGALMSYVAETQMQDMTHLKPARYYSVHDSMILDSTTVKNLELKDGLVTTLDHTMTSMGSRLFVSWILKPLLSCEKIILRHNAVEELAKEAMRREQVREQLRQVSDLERIASRIASGSASPRDLLALRTTLLCLPALREMLGRSSSALLLKHADLALMEDTAELIGSSISESAPAGISEGNIIKVGYDKDLDELRQVSRDAKAFIRGIEEEEKQRTGIRSLKIGYNRVFGYYIEVTKTQLSLVPADYIKKQTLANAERYITEKLKEKESIVLGSDEKSIALEQHIFSDICSRIAQKTKTLQETAESIAVIDVLASFADSAVRNRYCRPAVHEGFETRIREGRHPFIEKMTDFVPNDLDLDKPNRTMIITGPNMAGKSVYMRQNALIILMAQTGSFVPAKSAKVGIVDRIFTRVGASDDSSKGQSTFMMEMSETAQILQNATDRSFIVLDEIGRGTSTFDGVSIAWAVAEHITGTIKAKCMFATHYHVLNQMEKEIEGVRNYNIAVKEDDDKIIFLRKILEGGTDKSYGIHVAKLAGVPEEVVLRAREIQLKLEDEDRMAESIVIERKAVQKAGQKPDAKAEIFTKAKQVRLDELF